MSNSSPSIQSPLAQARPGLASAMASALAWAPLWAVLLWTGNVIVTKSAVAVIEPASITLYRWLLAFLVLAPFVAKPVWDRRAIVLAHWWKLGVLGVLGMAMYQGLAYQAAHTTSAVNMGIILAIMPLASVLLAAAISSEPLGIRRVGGAIISLAGLIIVTTRGQPLMLLDSGAHVGDILMLVAVLSNAVYGALLKRWALPLSTWQQLFVQIGFGVVILVPFWLAAPISPVTVANVPLILYAGIAASIGAPFFWITGIKRMGAARASQFMNLLPLFVAAAAWALLGESLHPYHAIGAAIALAGVALGLKQKK